MMRCMLVSNLALDQRFCNGAQGRALHWHPEKTHARKAISASHPELLVRFAKEASLKKPEMIPDVDHMDVTARQETLVTIPGQPVLLQIPLVPAYALTIVELIIHHACNSLLFACMFFLCAAKTKYSFVLHMGSFANPCSVCIILINRIHKTQALHSLRVGEGCEKE